jgi:ribonuclease HI
VIGLSEADTACQFILVLWRTWFVRNSWVHEGKWINGSASVNFLMSYWDSLIAIRQGGVVDVKGKRPVGEFRVSSEAKLMTAAGSWKPPKEGWIKINVDGAYMDNSRDAGIGVVIRDSSGSVLLTAWKFISDAGSAEEVEALACKGGLLLAAEWMSSPSILESDCANIIKYLHQPEPQRSASALTIQEALEEARKLQSVVFLHVGREFNSVAHSLAQLARRLSHSAVWHNRFPFCV